MIRAGNLMNVSLADAPFREDNRCRHGVGVSFSCSAQQTSRAATLLQRAFDLQFSHESTNLLGRMHVTRESALKVCSM